jgi:hypothetical protein
MFAIIVFVFEAVFFVVGHDVDFFDGTATQRIEGGAEGVPAPVGGAEPEFAV